jgi:hypothetical protein
VSRPDEALVVGHFPGYAPVMHRPDILHRMKQTGCDSGGLSEAYSIAGIVLHSDPDYRVRVGRSTVDTRAVRSPRGDAGDTPVIVREDRRLVASKTMRVTAPGMPRKFAPERWLTVVTYEHPLGFVTHVNVHPSPVFCGPLAWRRNMIAAVRAVRSARAVGNHVVLTGDLQTKRVVRGMLADAGLSAWNSGVDWLAWSKGLQLVSTRAFRVEDLDHPWLVGVFAAAS